MKNRFAIFVLSVVFLIGSAMPVLAAGEKPGTVVKEFFTLMSKAEWTAAKKHLAGKELQQMISGLESIYKELSAAEKKSDALESFGAQAKLKVVSEKITGDKAVVTVTYQEKKKTKKESYNLKKVNGAWKIVD